jgi:hypothetical protein
MKSVVARGTAVGVILGGVILSLPAFAGVPMFSQVPLVKGEEDFCLDKQDGAYQHPDCRVYYSCRRHTEAEVKCPEGQVFDADKNPSDDPGKSYCSAPESVASLDCGGVK